MDNPWATAWDDPSRQADDSAWSVHTAPPWPATDASWVSSTALRSQEDSTTQDQLRGISQLPSPAVVEPSAALGGSVSDHQVARSTSPLRDAIDPVPETSDATLPTIELVARVFDEENLEAALDPPEDDWGVPWRSSEANTAETQPPDHWEAARQEKEKLNRTVPPESLDSLLRHCKQVSQEIWPASGTDSKDDWSSGFDDLADIAVLLAQLVPVDSTLPPTVQFSATSTAKAMNEALKLTRHLPASATSPLSRLLASKGSLEWEKSIRAKQDIAPDTARVGWRVLEKEDRFDTVEESKPRKATGGLLSFWNRRASAIPATSVETPRERSRSPAKSSLESAQAVPHAPSSQVLSPSSPSVPSLPDSHPSVVATATTPSVVSRFLNRFSRTKGAQHSSLALSSDDLEFLSDIVPSASDPPDDDINDSTLDALTGASNSSLPPKLPPPIPPPPKQLIPSTRLFSAPVLGTLDDMSVNGSAPIAFQVQGANHIHDVPALDPPLTPKVAFSRTQSPAVSLKDVSPSTIASARSSIPLIQHGLPQSSQPNPQPHSSFTLPPPQRVLPLLSIPPLLPPPPVSPPQTPRPSAFPSIITSGHSFTMRSADISSFHDSWDPDDIFTGFTSIPSSAPVPFPSSGSYPSQRSPSPPSPPPRRTYERTHYPSSSSPSSILSPASQTSVDQLYSTSPISASLDSFGDFVSPPSAVQSTPSPPPLPIKPQSLPLQPSRIGTLPSRVYHAHTPSQTPTSPTVRTGLLNSALSASSVSNAEHQRTQSLVNHAAARGGSLWPNSPSSDERRVRAIPPPSSSSTSPKSTIGEGFDLLGDGGLETLPTGGMGIDSTVSLHTTGALRALSGDAGGQGNGPGLRNQLHPSPPPFPATSTPILSFSSQGTLLPAATTNVGSTQPAKSKQTGGLSAQDLSFFEGL